MRVAGILTGFALAAGSAAPAAACIIAGPPSTYYVELPVANLQPDEVVLEVRFVGRESDNAPPSFFAGRDRIIIGRTVTDELAVVRVVHGRFDSDAVLIPTSTNCGGMLTTPPGGGETGFVVGVPTRTDPDWDDVPALAARIRLLREGLQHDQVFVPLIELPEISLPDEPPLILPP